VFFTGVYCWRDAAQAFRLGGNQQFKLEYYSNGDNQADPTYIPVPSDKDSIGWEIDAGFDWKLLENLTWNMVFAYWQPGEWWKYALPDTASFWATTYPNFPTAGGSINPNREIDPLFAIESTLSIHF
jgi:hypothetical protein